MINPGIHRNKLVTAAFVISCCFVCGCENDDAVIHELNSKKLMVEEISKVEAFFSEGGKMKSKLTAPLMYMVAADTQYVEFPKTLHADFYNDSIKVESWLDARYGKYFQGYNKVYLRDSVVVISAKGDTLRTNELWWDQNRALFYTDSVATYHSPGSEITGSKGMEASQDFKTVTFKSPIASMKVSETGFAE